MNHILFQVVFLGLYVALLLLLRKWAITRMHRLAEEEYERQEALRRELKVGVPYDPDPKWQRPRRH